ncbi:MAG: aminoglycoside phosphotransferase family protein [Chthoniobacterales bacterium]
MTADQLLQKTKEHFPQLEHSLLVPIYEGGSDRQFYRCTDISGASLIVIHYSTEKEENRYYGDHALFLKKQGISVPAVLGHNATERLLWLQDLGEKTLWSIRDAPWEVRRPWYELALMEAARLHRLSFHQIKKQGVLLQPPFDVDLYAWEQDYFFEYALGSLFNVDLKKRERLAASAPLQSLSRYLAELPRQLVHRDLQSQNILLFESRVWFIDFQGMRAGLAPYDLASLLYDPYVTLTSSEQKELLDFYQQEMKKHHFSFPFDIEKVFWHCAIQRLMQALGCYGYLGLHRGKPHFLKHVPSALKGLLHALTQLDLEDHLNELADLLATTQQLKFKV